MRINVFYLLGGLALVGLGLLIGYCSFPDVRVVEECNVQRLSNTEQGILVCEKKGGTPVFDTDGSNAESGLYKECKLPKED